MKRADGVVCVSEYTASEVRHLLDVPEEKIAVTPHGIDPIFAQEPAPEAVEQALRRYGLPRGGILYLGSDEKRKNLVTLVMAYFALARKRRDVPPLVLVGPGSQWSQGGSRIGPQIRATGYLPREDVRALFAASAMLVLPSLEEGFGLPVVEAMAARPAGRVLDGLRLLRGGGRRGPPRRDAGDGRRSRTRSRGCSTTRRSPPRCARAGTSAAGSSTGSAPPR